jgi:hypothetical protein
MPSACRLREVWNCQPTEESDVENKLRDVASSAAAAYVGGSNLTSLACRVMFSSVSFMARNGCFLSWAGTCCVF